MGALCLLSGSALGARQLRGNRRESRNLLGTFPFNAQEGEHHGAHDDHHGHHGEEIEYDDVVQCDHSYDRRCHTTYVTQYESQQEEDCEENFRKSCFIEYEQIAFNETAKVCRTPLVKDCDVQGPEICRTEYESECWTKQEVHDVQDDVVECETIVEEKCQDETSGYTTNTKCSKWPKEVCRVSKKNVKKYTPIT